MRKQNGITLVSLIITIIVMVILAGVVIVTATMEGGIIDRAKTAMIENEKAEIEEIIETSFIYKTIASQNITHISLDIPKTAESIFKNLTASDYKLKTSEGKIASKVEDIYVSGSEQINLYIEGSEEFVGVVDKNGLKDGVKLKKDVQIENTPEDTTGQLPEETTPPAEEKYLTLSTNVDQIFTNDFKNIYGNFGTSVLANLAKLVYKSGEDTLEIVNDRTDTMGTTYLVHVKYYKNNELTNTYTLRGSSMYFSDDGTAKEGFTCHYYPHYASGWSDNRKVGGCTCVEHPGTIVYGSISEANFPKFTGEWEIDLSNSNDYGKQYLTNVLIEK